MRRLTTTITAWAALLSLAGIGGAQEMVRVEGITLGPYERVAAGVEVRLRGDVGQASALSDGNGYFDLGSLAPGEYEVSAEAGGEIVAGSTMRLAPGRAFLRVSTSGWIERGDAGIEGRIEVEGESEGIVVSAENVETEERLEATTSARGRFEIAAMPSGTYALRARRGGELLAEGTLHVGWLAREFLRISRDDGVERETGFFAGRAEDGEGNGLGGVSIEVTHVQTGETRRFTTDEYGSFGTEEGLAAAVYRVRVARGEETLLEQGIFLHPHMYVDISTVHGIREGGAEAAQDNGDDEPGYNTVRIFYGTDRKRQPGAAPAETYGAERGVLELGTCEVSIPIDHRIGELESPSFWRLEFREDPEKHVVLLSVEPQERDAFVAELRGRVESSGSRAAFVFVHGYNVSFEDAARRTGQMAYDLQFDGAPILYSWPSRGSLAPLAYTADEAVVEWTVPHLREFLRLVAAESGAETVHLIAHSMGNRALTAVLREFATAGDGPRFSQIALVAPDIDADIFKRDIAPRIAASGDRVTLYASGDDEALKASKRVHAAPRAGDASEQIVVVPGIDTIDVSGLDTSLLGHSYFAENASVISDLIRLLATGSPPESRTGLEEVLLGGLRYWRFQPQP